MAQITMGQWRKRLGEAVPFEQVPDELGVPSMAVVRAVNGGKLPLHTFKATDGRVFRMVKTRDLEAYRRQAENPAPAITIEGMKAAFREMAGG